jgi:ABC-2 type transport system ATP-binding protein
VTRSGGIELTGLTKSFPSPQGPVRAVRGIDVSIAAGEIIALLGPNGAGKSTTIDMILGLLEPDRGSVSVFGRSPSKAVDQGAVGAMLQTGALIKDLSVRELVTMIASLYPAPLGVQEVLELTGTDEFADQRTNKLSGGQTQLGGTWFPITGNGFLHDIVQLIPSYWLVQASHVAIGGHAWPARGAGS